MLLGILLLLIGGGSLYFYNVESNRIFNKYFDKGYEAGKSGNYDDVPELAEEETKERERILPCCYLGIGFLFIGGIITIYGFFAQEEKKYIVKNPSKTYLVTCPDCQEKTYFFNKNNRVLCQKCGRLLRKGNK